MLNIFTEVIILAYNEQIMIDPLVLLAATDKDYL